MPIYETEKSKRQPQGNKCDSARAMRLYHDCWRHILVLWKDKTQKDKTQNDGFVSFGNCRQHQLVSWLIAG